MPRFLFPLALLAAGLLFTSARADNTHCEEGTVSEEWAREFFKE